MQIQKMTVENFAYYGTLMTQPRRTPHSLLVGSTYWGQVMTGDFATAVDISLLSPTLITNKITVLEQHQKTPEIVLMQEGRATVAFAQDKQGEPDLTTLRCFCVDQGEAYQINAKVWHSGFILAEDKKCSAVILLQKGTQTDDCSFFKLKTPLLPE